MVILEKKFEKYCMTLRVFTADERDITCVVVDNFSYSDLNRIIIPSSATVRSRYFGKTDQGNYSVTVELGDTPRQTFDVSAEVVIDLNTQNIYKYNYKLLESQLRDIHKTLTLKCGRMDEEFNEQVMAFRFLRPEHKVLEIGGNIGRNSLIIAHILAQKNLDGNLVVLECDPRSAKILAENRDRNNFVFHVESSALSGVKLIQKGWDTIPSDILLHGYNWVNTVSYDDLKKKYPIDFDALVLDCEGAFYYILHDFPQILDGIKLVILENDFSTSTQKEYVDSVLEKNDFVNVYAAPLGHNIEKFAHCKSFFYQVWKKK